MVREDLWELVKNLQPHSFSERDPNRVGSLGDFSDEDYSDVPRLRTRFNNIDEMFDGGLPLGASIQFGGSAGSGKSTLLLQILDALWSKAVYITSEEKVKDIGRRARRLRLKHFSDLRVEETDDVERVKTIISKDGAKLVIVDSLPMLLRYDEEGSVQKHNALVERDLAREIVTCAKDANVTVILVWHINNEDKMSGLRVNEHKVDAVAQLMGSDGPRRILKCTKNRFGPGGSAYFNMTATGLVEFVPEEPEAAYDDEPEVPDAEDDGADGDAGSDPGSVRTRPKRISGRKRPAARRNAET